MKNVSLIALVFLASMFSSCGGNSSKSNETKSDNTSDASNSETYDPKRGMGKWTADLLALPDKIDDAQAKAGEAIAAVKCFSCHKITGEKLVGPGWKGVTGRFTAPWIMNFITNPDPMISKDPELQALLELCLVRMPNQNLKDDEARSLLEFMRKNDSLK